MKGKTPSVQSRLVGTILAAGLVLAVAASAHALSGSGMDLPVESDPRNHPGLNVYARDFNVYTGNVYTGASMPPGWTSMDTLSVDFTDHLMWGTMTSEVWKDTGGCPVRS